MQLARSSCWMVAFLTVLSLPAWTGTPGSFRGTIVDNPQAGKGWIYVQGRNGMARRVEISHARVIYDEDVPAAERHPRPEEALTPGTEVRVEAEQGSDGEWRASTVEILKAAVAAEPGQKQIAISKEQPANSN